MARHLLQNYSLQWAIAVLKPTRCFTESTRFFAQPSWFFAEPTWFLFKTDSIGLQNRLNSLNRTDSIIEPTLFFYRTDSIILLEPTWFFYRTDLIILLEPTWFFTEPTRLYFGGSGYITTT